MTEPQHNSPKLMKLQFKLESIIWNLDRLITILRISKHPVKNTNDLGSAGQNIAENHHSDPGGTLEKIRQLFSLAEMKNLTFQKRSKKILDCIKGQIIPAKNNNRKKSSRVSRPLSMRVFALRGRD